MKFKDNIFGLVSSLLTFIVFITILYINYRADNNLMLLEFKSQRESTLTLSEDSFRELQSIVEQDLNLLVRSYENHLNDPQSITLLFQDLLIARQTLYLQARIIDLAGLEKIRVDNHHDTIRTSKQSELQNKSSRSYFTNTLAIDKDQVYWSPIDLNVERGVIQKPYIATTRAAKTLSDPEGNKIGIVILNLDLNRLYQKIYSLVESKNLNFIHTDHQGHFMFHPDEALRWGNLFPYRKHITLTETITKDIQPIANEIQTVKSKKGSILSVQYSPNNGLHSGYIGVSTPRSQIEAAISTLRYSYYYYLCIGLLLCFAFSYIILRYHKIKFEHQKQVKISLTEAKKSAEFKSRFLANMSHEIRTPLNAIVGMLFLIKNDDPTPSQLKLINTLESSCSHLLSIVNDILDYSKIDSNMLKLEVEDFHLHEVLDNIAGISRQLSKDKDIEVLTSFSNDIICELSGDAFRLTQVLINLLSNAIKFTNKGHVTLDVKTVEHKNKVITQFVISDTGCGMTEETIALIRNPFQQADTSTTRRFGGTGLGISIVDQLVKLMGGTISIKSQINKGSTFALEIPYNKSSTKLNYRPYDQIDFTKLHVLVVDDDKVARDYLSSIIENFGCKVTSFHTGEEGLEFYQQCINSGESIHLIFMDWRLPGDNGLSIAKKINKLNAKQKPVIIMETAYGREIMREDGYAETINKLLIKPITPSDVFDVVNEQLSLLKDKNLPKSTSLSKLDNVLLQGIHVLVVDDNHVNQTVCGKILSKLGATYDVADNGAVAIELLESKHESIDIVLMDMQMPVLDGIEATKILRANSKFKTLPIIALTANVSKEDVRTCIGAGMNNYAAKPIDASTLAQLILRYTAKS